MQRETVSVRGQRTFSGVTSDAITILDLMLVTDSATEARDFIVSCVRGEEKHQAIEATSREETRKAYNPE